MSKESLDKAILALLYPGIKGKGAAFQKEHGIDTSNNSDIIAKRFYGYFIQNMRHIMDRSCPTAAVSITSHINLHINPDFFESLTPKQRVQVLEHECKHIVHDHFTRAKASNAENAKVWNLACDIEINDPLDSLHEFGITYAKVKELIPDLMAGETAEYYYFKIMEYGRQNGFDKLEGCGDTIDDHSKWGNGDEDGEGNGNNSELTKETIRNAMRKTIEQAGGRGVVPHSILEALERMNKSTVNWKQQLRRFHARADKFLKQLSRRKRNRRYGYMVSGKNKKPNTHLAIALDESGSVGNDEFVQFFAEIDKIVESGTKVTMIHADATVNKVYEYKAKMPIERTGCGGTCYMPAIDHAKTLDVDGMIYFGDGDNFGEVLYKPQFPLLWALVRESPAPADWGAVCRVKVKQNE